ncbi:MAG TPA: Crp/Fnr family transcriptional regulator [Puia sp.]|nr:Crp/Fnr family transcriptional regulator [Puia sp.]
MKQIAQAIQQMIEISGKELEDFLGKCSEKKFKRHEIISRSGIVPGEIFFINKGLIRVIIISNDGVEHSFHFALENQFIADYSAFMLKQPSLYTLRAEEETETVVMPRAAIEWGYRNLKQGDRLGRLIAEFYFIYHDNRIKNLYARTAKERYDSITEIFPDIHNRVPQHMIASYLGISPVHLSRLKKSNYKK